MLLLILTRFVRRYKEFFRKYWSIGYSVLAVLIGILAPAYTKYVERSRESVDLTNVRAAYDEIVAEVTLEGISTTTIGEGQKIPVIISTNDGKFYISETITTKRTTNSNYVVIAPRELQGRNYAKYLSDDKKYDSLEAAYDAYEKVITEDYPKYKDTLPNSNATIKATDRF